MGQENRRIRRAKSARLHHGSVAHRVRLPRLAGADRRTLLTGTALASTLLIAVIAAATPAHAVFTCAGDVGTSPAPIDHTAINDSIDCVNTEVRTNATGNTIGLSTVGANHALTLDNSGTLTAANAGFVFGIGGGTVGDNSDLNIVNSGDITATSTGSSALGITVGTDGANSDISVINSGDITASAANDATGIRVAKFTSGSSIDISNSGRITATSTGGLALGIDAYSISSDHSIGIVNSGAVTATAQGANDAYGMRVFAGGDTSPVTITNSGDVMVTGDTGDIYGIFVRTNSQDSDVDVVNTGDVTVSSNTNTAYGIYFRGYGANSDVTLDNAGDLSVTGQIAAGILTRTFQPNTSLLVENSGDITSTGSAFASAVGGTIAGQGSSMLVENTGDITASSANFTIAVFATGGGSATDASIVLANSGDVSTTAPNYATSLRAYTLADRSSISLDNSGTITATGGGTATAISTETRGSDSSIFADNSGNLNATSDAGNAYGIFALNLAANSSVNIINSGDVTATAANNAFGITVSTMDASNTIGIDNRGDIAVTGETLAFGIRAFTYADNSPVNIINSGDISASGALSSVGILARSIGNGGSVNIVNSGDINTTGQTNGGGIGAIAPSGSVSIENSGTVFAQGTTLAVGLYALSGTGTTIINSGDVSSSSLLAIRALGAGAANVYNSGTITGFVDLTEQADMFVNQSGGLFEARLTSDFRDGNDLFTNEAGGTVRALNIGGTGTRFDGLERFENRGTISMVDGAEGDSFTISNTPGGTDHTFNGSAGSTLAVDAFLGGPGSTSDILTIEGNVSGRTRLTVNNTNPGPGALNTVGIPVVFATGETPDAGAFFLEAPIDTGFFDYDLFFVPTGSGFWELRNFIGAGAQLLPQLLTAAQDIWHQGSSVWFDRSADLRVLLANGNAPAANLGSKSLSVPQNDGIAPAVWVRGSGSWLDRKGNGSTSAYGRNYRFDLDRDLETIDFQMGLDLGTRDLLSQGDALVFGMLGGFVHGGLDYDNLGRHFDFDGGQVGAYATYIKGGLFVDTLLNVHLMELNANGALGFPNNDLDATTVGLRTDTGYRFGSFSGGAFLEPLATIEVTWADIDGFSVGGNSVTFDDDANVRGRLGLRAGTTVDVWDSTIMEPFVTGSLWGTLSGDNQATLVSGGSSFRLEDQLDDVWGEVSAGVNFFNFSETTSVFAKVDVTFGDDISGVGGKAGMRVAW